MPLNPRGAQTGNQNARKAEEPPDDLPLMKGARENKSNDIRIESKKQGPNAERLTARIARDHPDILERMKAGEFPSVRKAALEAGIVKPTITIPDDPEAAARRLLRHFQGERLAALIRALEAQGVES